MLAFRPARPEDCDTIARHVRQLARDVRVDILPKVTGDDLRRHGFGEKPLLILWVAERDSTVVASIAANFMYSTWRGQAGIYVIDLYVEPEARSSRIGEKLLRALGKEAWDQGARFIRLDVDHNNEGAARFYERKGFKIHAADRYFGLEASDFENFLSAS
jgi:GNAT superfamily N-acetyltransferase